MLGSDLATEGSQSFWAVGASPAPIVRARPHPIGSTHFHFLLPTLNNQQYSLKAAIVVAVSLSDDGEWIAAFPEAELSRSGSNAIEALDWLKSSIVELYELFKGEDRLGPLPQRQLEAFEKYLVAKPNRT